MFDWLGAYLSSEDFFAFSLSLSGAVAFLYFLGFSIYHSENFGKYSHSTDRQFAQFILFNIFFGTPFIIFAPWWLPFALLLIPVVIAIGLATGFVVLVKVAIYGSKEDQRRENGNRG